MSERNFFTAEKRPKAIPHKNVYLTLIAEELNSYSKAHYQDQYLTYPIKLAKNYLQFENRYYDFLETHLQNFKGMQLSEFDEEYKKQLVKLYESESGEAINDAIAYIQEKIVGREDSHCLEIHKDLKINSNLRKMLKRKAIEQDNNGKNSDASEAIIVSLPEIPKSIFSRLKGKIRNIGKSGLMEEVFEHAKSRAKLSEDKIYKYKKLRHSIGEVYEDLVYSKTTEKPKKSILAKDDSEIINDAVNSYEIIGNRKYLINKRSYYKALGKHFRKKLKKDRKKYDN